MNLKYIGKSKELEYGKIYSVNIIGFIPKSDIVVQIKSNKFLMEKRYCSLNSLMKNFDKPYQAR